MTPEAMRRLADLQLEKQFGIRAGDGKPREMAAPESAPAVRPAPSSGRHGRERRHDRVGTGLREQRTTAQSGNAGGRGARRRRCHGSARGDRPLRPAAHRVPELRTERQGPLSEGAGVRRARPHRRGHRDHGAPDPREPAFRALRRSAIQAGRVLLHAETVPRGRGAPMRRSSAWAPTLRTTSSPSTSSVGRSTSRSSTRRPCSKYMALLDYKVSIGYAVRRDARRGRRAPRRGHLPGHQPELHQPRWAGGRPGVLLRVPDIGTTRTASTAISASTTWPSCATTTRRRRSKAFVALYPFHRAAPRFSMRVVDTFTQGGFPKLVLESKKEFATNVRTAGRVLAALQARGVARGPELPEVQPEGSREPLSRPVSEQGAREARSSRTTPRPVAGTATTSTSFPTDPDSPPINYQLADLLLEHKDFGEAAEAVRAHGLRIRRARAIGRRGLRRDLTPTASS